MKSLTTLLALTAPLQAATVLTEASGDFSDNYLAPTEMVLMPGLNTLSFTIGVIPGNGGGNGAIDGPADADFILFRLPAGASVTEMRVRISEGGGHFFGAREGTTFPVVPANTPGFIGSLDANFVFRQGSNLALQFLTDPDEDFIALFQETSDTSSFVTIDLTVVPEPSSALLLLLSAMSLLRRQR